MTQIRWKLRTVMADRKMSATALANLMGVNRVTVEGWKAMDTIPSFRNPSATLSEFCQHLNCRVSDLIQEETASTVH